MKKRMSNTYTCPVCGYNQLEDPPVNHEICPQCRTHFGYHDSTLSHATLRQRWMNRQKHQDQRIRAREHE